METSPKSNNLSLNVKKLLTLSSDAKSIFKLQDFNLSVNIFCSFFRIWNEVLAKNDNLTKTFILGTFWTATLGAYNLRIDLIHK